MKITKTFEFAETEIKDMIRIHINSEHPIPLLKNFKIKGIIPEWSGFYRLKVEIEELDETPTNK